MKRFITLWAALFALAGAGAQTAEVFRSEFVPFDTRDDAALLRRGNIAHYETFSPQIVVQQADTTTVGQVVEVPRAADRPRHLPPFGERRLGLHASGQRYPRSRRRGRPHAARIPHLSLHPPRTQRRDARPAPLEDSAVAGRRTGAAAGLRQQLPRLPAPAPHRRLFGGARSRLDCANTAC